MTNIEPRPYSTETIRDAYTNKVVLPSLYFTDDFADRLDQDGQELYLNEDEIVKGAIKLGLRRQGDIFFSGSLGDDPIEGQHISRGEGLHRLNRADPPVIFDAKRNLASVLYEPGSDFNPAFWASTLALNYIPMSEIAKHSQRSYGSFAFYYTLALFGFVGATGLPVEKAVQEHAHEPTVVAVAAGMAVGYSAGYALYKAYLSRLKSIYVRPAIRDRKIERLAKNYPVFTTQQEEMTT